MATADERREEARQDAREARFCMGCALGFEHDHEDDEDES